MLHQYEKNALAIHRFQEIVFHLNDVGVIQLRYNAQLSVLVLRVLYYLLHRQPLFRPLVHYLHQANITK